MSDSHLYGVQLRDGEPCKKVASELRRWIKDTGCVNLRRKPDYTFIGQGQFGSVFTVRSINKPADAQHCDLVVKEIKYPVGDPLYNDYVKLARSETKIQKIAARHNIGVKVWTDFECNHRMYIVMSRLPPGNTYRKYRDDPRLRFPRRTVEIIQSIIDKLGDFHELGYVHLDLHSNNIWVTETGETFLLDFGYARKITKVRHPSEAFVEDHNKIQRLADYTRLMWATTLKDPSVLQPADPGWKTLIRDLFGWELIDSQTIRRYSFSKNKEANYELWKLYLHVMEFKMDTPMVTAA